MKKKEKEATDIKDEKVIPEENNNNEIELLGNRIKELENSLLKNQAELINYKRRKEEEVSKLFKYANGDIILELINVLDNFERAISMDDDNLKDEVSKFLNGFQMIYNQLKNILEKNEVKEIESLNKEFDPMCHQAVMQVSDDNYEKGIILEVMQKGYIYKDKVIRPAMVKVNN